jgi:SNF2 family DNA or RNA helicase
VYIIISICISFINYILQKLSGLKAKLRPYQIEAIKWMLYKEKCGELENKQDDSDIDGDSDKKLHPLYVKVSNRNDQTIYLHRFYGVFSTELPLRSKPLPGGILADEMGLGACWIYILYHIISLSHIYIISYRFE